LAGGARFHLLPLVLTRFIAGDLPGLAGSAGYLMLPPVLTRFCGRDLPALAGRAGYLMLPPVLTRFCGRDLPALKLPWCGFRLLPADRTYLSAPHRKYRCGAHAY